MAPPDFWNNFLLTLVDHKSNTGNIGIDGPDDSLDFA